MVSTNRLVKVLDADILDDLELYAFAKGPDERAALVGMTCDGPVAGAGVAVSPGAVFLQGGATTVCRTRTLRPEHLNPACYTTPDTFTANTDTHGDN